LLKNESCEDCDLRATCYLSHYGDPVSVSTNGELYPIPRTKEWEREDEAGPYDYLEEAVRADIAEEVEKARDRENEKWEWAPKYIEKLLMVIGAQETRITELEAMAIKASVPTGKAQEKPLADGVEKLLTICSPKDGETVVDSAIRTIKELCDLTIKMELELEAQRKARDLDAKMGWSGIQECRKTLVDYLRANGWEREGIETPEEAILRVLGKLQRELAESKSPKDGICPPTSPPSSDSVIDFE